MWGVDDPIAAECRRPNGRTLFDVDARGQSPAPQTNSGHSQAVRDQARAALHRFSEHPPSGSTAFMPNTRIAAALDPLRALPALGLRCPCGYGIGWIALAEQGSYVVISRARKPKTQRTGGAADLDDNTKADPLSLIVNTGHAIRLPQTPIPQLAGEEESDNIHIESRTAPLRRAIACKKCKSRWTMKNETVLPMFLAAIATGSDRVQLKYGYK
jgi:hypothetical protein